MTRAERRHRMDRAIAKAERWCKLVGALRLSRTESERQGIIRKMAETHCRPCSCFMCVQHKEVPPRRERAF